MVEFLISETTLMISLLCMASEVILEGENYIPGEHTHRLPATMLVCAIAAKM